MAMLPFGPQTVFDALTWTAEKRPGAPFLIFDGVGGSVVHRSYAEMRERAIAMSQALLACGVTRGDRVHIHMTNTPGFYDCWFGTAAIGAVMVPTNPQLTAFELSYVVEHSRCTVGVTDPSLADALSRVHARGRVLVTDDEHVARLIGANVDTRADDLPAVDPLDVAAVMYTSGTTSRPKGVLVTHANYLHAGNVVAQHLRVRDDDRWLVVLPLFHANAQYYSTMSALVSGASVAVMARFSASQWARQAARHGATLGSLFAAPIRMILAQPPRPDDADNDLRAVIFSQNVTEEQLDDFERRFGAPLLQLYGMTETIAPPILNPLYGPRNNMSIGRPTLGARLRIKTDNSDASVGETGELLVFGEPGTTLMSGYLDDEQATAAAIEDDWLHTGDNVRLDADGFIYFVDRNKDMIKRAGENVAAGEVEAVANSHPAVFESAAVGVRDDMRDEAIKLFVVKKEGAELSEDALIEYCAERLAGFKMPSVVEFLDALPRTSVGKIRKDVLRGRGPGT
jgi:crotonobetaine/carnitine-CoA ligase